MALSLSLPQPPSRTLGFGACHAALPFEPPVRAIVHKYPDRVLLLALDHCSVYCRHCTRRRITSGDEGGITPGSTKIVSIPLNHRRTTVSLRAAGRLASGRRAVDVDRFTFERRLQ